MGYDLWLRGGTVVDGTDRPPFAADVLVKDGRIAAIGAFEGTAADQVLDVTGLVVAPGFIDMHAHSDICPLVPYLPESKIYQGVTSELNGNWADITVFDPKTVAETATYVEPMQKPRGIEYVIVNGQIVLRDGVITDARPGRALLAGR